MMRRLLTLLSGLAVLIIGLSAPALAGGNAGSGNQALVRHSPEDAADFAKQIERELAARGARVAIVFRSGEPRDQLPDGIRYTHGGIWVHSQIRADDGRVVNGYAVHNLYHGEIDRSRSYLAQDWPFDFTSGDALGEAGIIIPTPEMQRRILSLMQTGQYETLHEPEYSILSNPHDGRYQNCTEFLLDVIAAAAWETTNREQLKANLAAHFEPVPIRLTVFERMFGAQVDDRVRFDDHRGRVRTATWASITTFMNQYRLAADIYELDAAFLAEEV
jgi:hypothetical protein